MSYSRLKIVIPNLSENEDEDEDCISRAAINAALVETVNCIERAVEMDKKITEVEDYGWMTYEDKQTCIDILYELKEELCSKN